MATFRTVQVSIWEDDFVIDLTPEEKFFFIYLLTNHKTTQCGIFCIPKKIIEVDTGYNRETVDKLIKRFIDYGKILYNESTKEIIILNWIRYNFINSRNTICCINNELKNVKDMEFVKIFFTLCQKYGYPIDSIFKDIDISGFQQSSQENQQPEQVLFEDIQHINSPLEAPCKPLGETETELQTENTTTTTTLKDVVAFLNNNFHLMSPHEYEGIINWCQNMDYGVVLLAAQEAVTQNVRKMSYINGILNNWLSLGLTTVDKVKYQLCQWTKYKNQPDKTCKTEITCNNGAYEYLD